MFEEIRVFPSKTQYYPLDNMASFGFPDEKFLSMERDREVLISVLFSQDIKKGYELQYEWKKYFKNTRIGGPAISSYMDYNNGEFEPGKFIRNGIVFTSRGCNNNCPWCMVSKREGKLHTISIKSGYIIEDSNLFACDMDHIIAVFDMIKKQKKKVTFSGGIDVRVFNSKHMELLEANKNKIEALYFACDMDSNIPKLKEIHDLFLVDKPKLQKFVFCLMGFNESIEKSMQRYNKILEIGMIPNPSFYQPYEDHRIIYDEKYYKSMRYLMRCENVK